MRFAAGSTDPVGEEQSAPPPGQALDELAVESHEPPRVVSLTDGPQAQNTAGEGGPALRRWQIGVPSRSRTPLCRSRSRFPATRLASRCARRTPHHLGRARAPCTSRAHAWSRCAARRRSSVTISLHRRGQELMRKLLQGHLDQRSPGEAAGLVEGADGVDRSRRRVHERHLETTFGNGAGRAPGLRARWSRQSASARCRAQPAAGALLALRSPPWEQGQPPPEGSVVVLTFDGASSSCRAARRSPLGRRRRRAAPRCDGGCHRVRRQIDGLPWRPGFSRLSASTGSCRTLSARPDDRRATVAYPPGAGV